MQCLPVIYIELCTQPSPTTYIYLASEANNAVKISRAFLQLKSYVFGDIDNFSYPATITAMSSLVKSRSTIIITTHSHVNIISSFYARSWVMACHSTHDGCPRKANSIVENLQLIGNHPGVMKSMLVEFDVS